MTGRQAGRPRCGLPALAGAVVLTAGLMLAACGSEGPEPVMAGEPPDADESGVAPADVSPGERTPRQDRTPGQDRTPREDTVTFTPLLAETYTGVNEPLRQVVRDTDRWHDLWARVVAPVEPKPTAPAIDFDRGMVVIAALGTRSSGGYAVVVEELRRREERLEVVIVERVPGPTCPVTMALTAPLVAVVLPTSDTPTSFIERVETYNCP